MEKTRTGVTAPLGYSAGGIHCGVKKGDVLDLAMVVSQTEASAAGVFTANLVKGAPVLLSMANIKKGKIKGIVINSGNSNVMTPTADRDAMTMATDAADALRAPANRIIVASTGVIGQPLPVERVTEGIAKLSRILTPEGGADAARAIMTTDTFPKEAQTSLVIGGRKVTVGGMAKGSGMIHPNMATMLAFITTDAAVTPAVLRRMTRRVNEVSFNSITVDGDTSTSDMFIVLANGASGAAPITSASGKEFQALLGAMTDVARDLARMIVRDGEGATKFVTVRVAGARNPREARLAAMAVAKSSLVKTAVFGQDPNWGRALCALGYSGAKFDPRKVKLSICGMTVFNKGLAVIGDSRSNLKQKLADKEIDISAELGAGDGSAEVWTCDLSYEYVRINAEYTT
ncbi:MAG: bifunctional glutamate N-acetyltransferase/amino-acid acetyltransferase ArgJ [Nitrospinota bacterium]|nr:bifunctional glutamate N-acetyltransferase/amino-acid acetyltransferase ArgJ [Nitrospinota bacterium]MDH5677073.1 bifunctional glutamate N-acetyltransferase/amino-acid acetyltransferase ArgJ [Nitrospinota bacterium]MDH5755285.1 bifunctional glutamate N-acetyltransferase/amino-acid acetyltransferase ArgJ [Nitrospinota bacterium]